MAILIFLVSALLISAGMGLAFSTSLEPGARVMGSSFFLIVGLGGMLLTMN